MTARTPDAHPTFASQAERAVWGHVRDALPGEAILLANRRLSAEGKDHEADLLALLPGHGAIVIEVKGGAVSYDGGWWQSSADGRHRIDPINQALSAKYAFREYVESDSRWGSRGRIAWAHAFAAPYTSVPDDFTTPDCPRLMIQGRDDLADPTVLASRLEDVARHGAQGHRVPDHDDVEVMLDILNGRLLPPDRRAAAAERASVADRLTDEQATLLQVTRLLPRIEVRGGAGSGKTVLALAQSRQLTRGRPPEQRPQRVALLCYSYGLASHLQRVTQSWPRNHRPAYVGTYEGLARSWGVTDFGSRDDGDFWERRLPEQMARLAAELPPGKRFDAFVVDEAQDFADNWWDPLVLAMKDEERSGLYVYSDEHQRVFARFGRPPLTLVPLVLDHNLRNTRQIHETFSSLAPSRMTARGGDGPDVSFVPCLDPTLEETADDAVDILLDSGWGPGDVALLTTGKRHSVHLAETERLGHAGYWDSYWDDDEVFYGHVLGCKGLERPAVVLWVNEKRVGERSREMLYVGLSRATDHLVVVGDPDLIRQIGGEGVARRLGI